MLRTIFRHTCTACRRKCCEEQRFQRHDEAIPLEINIFRADLSLLTCMMAPRRHHMRRKCRREPFDYARRALAEFILSGAEGLSAKHAPRNDGSGMF